MHWPFKTTVRFMACGGAESRLDYLVAAASRVEAKAELERRFLGQEVFGYDIENVVPATAEEANEFPVPAGCVVMLG
jgi:hypothetical protein